MFLECSPTNAFYSTAEDQAQIQLSLVRYTSFVCYLQTALHVHCCSPTYQCNGTYFLISTDNRGQTRTKTPNYVTEEPIKMQAKLAFLGATHSWGYRDTAINDTKMCALVIQVAEEERDLKRGIQLLFLFSVIRIRVQAGLLN